MNPYLRETAIGAAAACFSLVVIVALMEGGAASHFASAVLLLLLSFAAPLLAIPALPWLAVIAAAAGVLLYLQYKRLPHRFMRFLVGAEVIAWQVLGMWCVANVLAG